MNSRLLHFYTALIEDSKDSEDFPWVFNKKIHQRMYRITRCNDHPKILEKIPKKPHL